MERYGLAGSFRARTGQAGALADLLLEAARALEADAECELYVVSRSADDPDAIWVTEVWASREAHRASLDDERIREIIARARPLLAGLGERFELSPLGGKGLPVG